MTVFTASLLCVVLATHLCHSRQDGVYRSRMEKRRKKLEQLKSFNLTCGEQGRYYRNFKRFEFYGQNGTDNLLQRLKGKWDCRDSKVTGVIDVGANSGQDNEYFAETFADSKCWGERAHIYLFEPNTKLLPTLRESAEAASKLGDVDFEVLNAAASNESGTAHFDLQGYDQLSGLSKVQTSTSITIQTLRLDNWVRERGITRIPLLKIDAEGFDPQVLQGAVGIFPLVEVLLWECHELMTQNGFTLLSTVDFLESHGFATYVIGQAASLALNRPHWHRSFEKKTWQNCVSFPRDSPLHTYDNIPGPCTRRMTNR